MRLPDFLIIGAMKAGTTTFYHDLLSNPRVFMPADKEPHALTTDTILTDEGKSAYAALFDAALPDQKCGEASTGYSKLPDFPGVPQRARQVLGGGLKLMYLVREPVSRLLSHNHHRSSSGVFDSPDIERNIRRYPELINWSRYAMQAKAWIEIFGRESLMIIRFEDYVADRRAWIAKSSEFIGVESRPELVNVDVYYNQSDGKPIMTGAWRTIAHSGGYRRLIRPLLPATLKQRLRGLVLPKAPPKPVPPSADTVRRIVDELRADLDDLRILMGLSGPVWDMEAVIESFRRTSTPARG